MLSYEGDDIADRQEKDDGDEIIEIVECPGIDGTRSRNTQMGQRIRTRLVR